MDGINVAGTTLFCGEKQMAFSCTICTHESELKNDLKNYNFQQLYDPLNKSTIEQLQKVAAEFIRNFTSDPDLLMKIDKLTADQSDSKWWNVFRSGRITASNMKDVCCTKPEQPSMSLVKRICYPNEATFTSSATRYGKTYEVKAVEQLFESVKHLHQNLLKRKSGFVIHEDYPFMGASPDAIFLCDCHGVITVEVKCPFSARNRADMVDTLLQLKDSFITRNEEHHIILKTKHKYFFQAFMQVHICKANFGYFYVWSPHQVLVFEIKRNDNYWEICKNKALSFFENVIFPELVAKKITEK